jgi:hypothetical protein
VPANYYDYQFKEEGFSPLSLNITQEVGDILTEFNRRFLNSFECTKFSVPGPIGYEYFARAKVFH